MRSPPHTPPDPLISPTNRSLAPPPYCGGSSRPWRPADALQASRGDSRTDALQDVAGTSTSLTAVQFRIGLGESVKLAPALRGLKVEAVGWFEWLHLVRETVADQELVFLPSLKRAEEGITGRALSVLAASLRDSTR